MTASTREVKMARREGAPAARARRRTPRDEERGPVKSEGVIKFRAEHTGAPLPPCRIQSAAAELAAWRTVLFAQGLIGQDPARYDGAGYGNLSARLGDAGSPGARPFLITGTQTGGAPESDLTQFCEVKRWDLGRGTVESQGPILPSSESMTHGALYDVDPSLRFVFHVHCPDIFGAARTLALPSVDEGIAYGTPEMAKAVATLYRDSDLRERRLLVMLGHEDGVVSFGRTAKDAGDALLEVLTEVYGLRFALTGSVRAPR